MTPEEILITAVRPALNWMGPRFSGSLAERQIMAIGLQESGLAHRRQVIKNGRKGPACGWFQFEVGGCSEALRLDRWGYVRALKLPSDPAQLRLTLEWSEIGAVVCARLLLWGEPRPLPGPEDVDEGWRQYFEQWDPGKPHPERWPANWARASAALEASAA